MNNELHQQLTIIITTSPIKSHPSTQLLDITINSFKLIDKLDDCKKIIMCDGYKIGLTCDDNKFKSGIIDENHAKKYLTFLEIIKRKSSSNEYNNSLIHIQSHHCGFAENIKFALYNYVKTPYVMIVQHDYMFVRFVDITSIINCMNYNDDVKYVGILSHSHKNYVNRVLSKPDYHVFYEDLEIQINAYSTINNETYKFGYDENNLLNENNKLCFQNDNTKDKNYVTQSILNYTTHKYNLPLMPIILWYDKIHICKTLFYKTFVFETIHIDYGSNNINTGKHKQIKRVKSFIEDTLGNVEMNNIKRHGIMAFNNYGTFVLNDANMPAIIHKNGRGFISK